MTRHAGAAGARRYEGPDAPPRIAIVVLNWNNAEDTRRCLASLDTLTYPCYAVFVVDNGSDDDSVQQICTDYPSVTLIETGANLGYAGGNNVGIRHVLDQAFDYVCILNNDTTVSDDFLDALSQALQADPTVGVATPLVADMNEPERIWALGLSIDWHTAQVERRCVGERVASWLGRAVEPVDIASGTAMLIKREVFESVGVLDEGYFLYYEEADWCLQVLAGGYRIVGVPSSIIFHKVSAALGPSSPVIDYYMLRNHLRLIGRHWSGLRRVRLLIGTALRDLITIAAYTIKPKKGTRLPNRNARLLAFRDAWLRRWGEMGPDVMAVCCEGNR